MNANPSKPLEGLKHPWTAALAADRALSLPVREVYREVIEGFLAFCAGRGREASVALAREHVELLQLEHGPSAARLQGWKEALNWYFRRGREDRAVALKGVPSLARADLGRVPWEQALIAGVRERHLAWRTEQAYRGWMWRFVRWLEQAGGRNSTPHPRSLSPVEPEREGGGGAARLAEAGAAQVREFLSELAVKERASVSAQKQAFHPVR